MAAKTIQYGTWDDLVLARVQDSSLAQKKAWEKAYKLRKYVAGDTSDLFGMPSQQESRKNESPISLDGLYDFIVVSFDEGKSNEILRGVRTLLLQVAQRFPEIDFEDLTPELAAINGGCVKQLLGPPPKGCAAVDEMRRVLLDYLIGGMGFTTVAFNDRGRPDVRAADSLDVSWDTTSQIPTRMRWASHRMRKTLGEWIEWFQFNRNTNILKKVAGFDTFKGSDFDLIKEVEFYTDTDGNKGRGTSYYIIRDSRYSQGTIVLKDSNPFYYENEDGSKMPFLPVTPIYFMGLPSTRGSVSVVEMALPDQVAIWRDETKIGEYIKRMGSYYAVPKGSMTQEQIEAFEQGEVGGMIQFDSKSQPPTVIQGGEVPRTVLEHRDSHKTSLVGSIGANPYANGTPVEGTSFASESNQIGTMSQLTAQAVGADYNGLWVDTVRKLLGLIAVYGDFSITVPYNNVPMSFDKSNPISDLIVPDADISIREDSTIYQSRRDRINEALADLQVAQGIMNIAPNAVAIMAENYFKARGMQNIKEIMEPPKQQPMQTPDMMSGADMAGANM